MANLSKSSSIWCSQWAPIARCTYKTCFCFRFFLLWSAHWLIFRYLHGKRVIRAWSLWSLTLSVGWECLCHNADLHLLRKEFFEMLGRVWTLNGVTLILRFSSYSFLLVVWGESNWVYVRLRGHERFWKGLHLSKVSKVDPMELNCI